MKVMEVQDLTKDFGNGKGVFHLDFSVEQGEIYGFLGPNGAGKTTTIRQLMGFLKPDQGKASIFEMDCFKSREQIQTRVGYLPGEIALMEEMKAIEFLRFLADMKGLSSFQKARELMERFELEPGGKIRKMSKGNRQKVAIVAAFMGEPQLMLLDEPTSGLDPLMQNAFVELLLEERDKGTTVFMSSHIFEEVEKTCDRAAIIREGQLMSIESMENIRRNRKNRYDIRFATVKEAEKFAQGRPLSQQKGRNVHLEKAQSVDELIKELSNYEISDFRSNPQTLEEYFLHFYGKEGGEIR